MQMCRGYPSLNLDKIFVEHLIGISFIPFEMELGEVSGDPHVHRLAQHVVCV